MEKINKTQKFRKKKYNQKRKMHGQNKKVLYSRWMANIKNPDMKDSEDDPYRC